MSKSLSSSILHEMRINFNFNSLSFLFIISVLTNRFVISDNLTPHGVPLSRAALYDPLKDFSCLDGSKLIPFSMVNDDYCDW
jgi:protein kinase C substrate 80K-H